MKPLPHLLLLAALGAGVWLFTQESRGPLEILTVRTTAYSSEETPDYRYADLTAAGTPLQATARHTSAAADWSRFPVGTRFRIRGEPTLYQVEDYGGALVGTDTIDLYRPSLDAVAEWGAREVEIEILEKGSLEEAVRILSGRLDHPSCKAMYDAILERHPDLAVE